MSLIQKSLEGGRGIKKLMTNEEWIKWLEDIKFNLEYIPVRIKNKETGAFENKRLHELTMKEGMKFITLWARGQKKKDESM